MACLTYGPLMNFTGIFALLLLTSATFIGGCGNKKSIDSYPESTLRIEGSHAIETSARKLKNELQNPLLPLSYEFSNLDDPNPNMRRQCSTGHLQFQNEHELCTRLLDHEYNQNCAGQIRYNTFMKFCVPKGFLAFDGLQCKVGVYRADAIRPSLSTDAQRCYEQVIDANLALMQTACVGRKLGFQDATYSATYQSTMLRPDLRLNIEKAYVLPAQISDSNTTRFNVQFVTSNEIIESEFKNGLTMRVGCESRQIQLGSFSEQLVVACIPVAGCH